MCGCRVMIVLISLVTCNGVWAAGEGSGAARGKQVEANPLPGGQDAAARKSTPVHSPSYWLHKLARMRTRAGMERVVRELAALGGASLAPAMTSYRSGRLDPRRAAMLLDLFGQVDDARAGKFLLRLLRAGEKDELRYAFDRQAPAILRNLALRGEPEAGEALLAFKPTSERQALACLHALLASADSTRLARAARFLLDRHKVVSRRTVRQLLRFLHDTELSAEDALTTLIEELSDAAADQAADERAAMPEHVYRNLMAVCVGLPGAEDSTRLVVKALDSDDLGLQRAALEALAQAPRLLADEEVRAAAAAGLRRCTGAPTALAVLGAISHSRRREAMPLAVQLLDHQSRQVRQAAIKALVSITGKGLAPNPKVFKKRSAAHSGKRTR